MKRNTKENTNSLKAFSSQLNNGFHSVRLSLVILDVLLTIFFEVVCPRILMNNDYLQHDEQ